MSQRPASKLLLIGWDAADWKIIKPLLDRGRLPNLNRLIERGVMGNLATIRPMMSPMLWTSIATGKRPEKHGILGFIEPGDEGRGVRPVTSTSRKSKALWNILTQQGFKAHLVGWYASHPAEPINGICVSDRFGKAVADHGQPWPMPDGTVHPQELAATFSELRIHPGELGLSDLLPFVPGASGIDQTVDRRLMALGQTVAECASIQAAATWVLESQAWDFLGVYFNAIDHFCHRFMHYHPPRLEQVPEADFALYSNVIWAAYCFHDLMLGRLLELAGEDATVLLVSDHGYHSDHLRPAATPKEPAGPAHWHRDMGVCVLAGPGIRRDELLFGATILDVTPTVLTLFGLPVGEDMDGKPWLNAFEHPAAIERVPSWDTIEGPCGMHPSERRGDPFHEREALAQLINLGYIAAPPEDEEEAGRQASNERDYNLAQALLDAGKPGEAVPILERLHAQMPDRLMIALHLINAYLAVDRRDDCRRLVEHLAAGNCEQSAIEDPNVKILAQVDYLRGLLEQAEGRTDSAVEHFRRAERQSTRLRGLQGHLGQAYARLARWPEAGAAFASALEQDPDDAKAHHGMAVALLAQSRNESAMEHALRSVGLLYHQPRAHYHLGIALMRLGQNERALQAFEVSLAMAPNQPDIHLQLAEFHATIMKDPVRSAEHARRAEELAARRPAARLPPSGPLPPSGDQRDDRLWISKPCRD